MSQWDRLLALGSAQQSFEEIRRKALMRFGPRLCDFGYANPQDGPPQSVLNSIRAALDSDRGLDLQYTPYGGATLTRRLVGQDLGRKTGVRFRFRQIVMTPGAMSALNLLLRTLTDDTKDEVLVIRPCWLDIPLYVENLGLKTRFVDLDEDFDLDLHAVEQALTDRTGAILLSQPANPTGRVYSAERLSSLANLLDRSGSPLWISDECHRDIYWGNEPPSPVSFYPRTCVVYSFGKRFFIQGQRIGFAAVSPDFPNGEEFAQKLEFLMRTMGFSTPTALMQRAVMDLLSIESDLSLIAQRKQLLMEKLGDYYELVPSDATFFSYGRCPYEDDMRFAEEVAERGVLVLPSSMFHDKGHFRISLTASDEMLDRGIEILADMGQKRGS